MTRTNFHLWQKMHGQPMRVARKKHGKNCCKKETEKLCPDLLVQCIRAVFFPDQVRHRRHGRGPERGTAPERQVFVELYVSRT